MDTIDIMPPSRPRRSPLYYFADHDDVLASLPPETLLAHHDGEVARASTFAEKYHGAPGQFYRDGDKIYCRGEEPEVAYTVFESAREPTVERTSRPGYWPSRSKK